MPARTRRLRIAFPQPLQIPSRTVELSSLLFCRPFLFLQPKAVAMFELDQLAEDGSIIGLAGHRRLIRLGNAMQAIGCGNDERLKAILFLLAAMDMIPCTLTNGRAFLFGKPPPFFVQGSQFLVCRHN